MDNSECQSRLADLQFNVGGVTPVKVKPTLEQKIARIRQNLKYTEKRGENKFHHYNYVMAADIAADMGKLLAEAGVVIGRRNLVVTWAEVGDQTEARLTCTYVLRDVDTGAELHFDSAGQGRDKGDKGVYKAHTGAYKYFFIQALAMPIGDDPENDSNERGGSKAPTVEDMVGTLHSGPMTDEQCQEIVRLIGMANVEVKKVLDGYKVNAIKDLPYEKVKKALGAKLRKGPGKEVLNEVAKDYPAVPPEA